jgi:hypothetical protein
MTTNLESDSASQTRVIPLDVEHGAVRVLLPILAIVGFILGYVVATWVINALHVETASGCIAALAGLAVAGTFTIGGNRALARLLPSKRSLLLSPEALELREQMQQGQSTVRIDWEQRINVLAWRFTVQRATVRAQKGWYMLGVQLLQDSAVLSLYTFASPNDAAAMPHYEMFKSLMPRSAIQKSEVSLRELADQRRLLQAEDERWQHGAEVRQGDFTILMTTITQQMAVQARHDKADVIDDPAAAS